jgi:hypothetical protein
MRRRRQVQVRLEDALVAAADETAVDETEARGAGTADAAGGRDGAAGARKRRRGEGESEDDGGEGADDAVAARLTAGDDDGVRARRATCALSVCLSVCRYVCALAGLRWTPPLSLRGRGGRCVGYLGPPFCPPRLRLLSRLPRVRGRAIESEREADGGGFPSQCPHQCPLSMPSSSHLWLTLWY